MVMDKSKRLLLGIEGLVAVAFLLSRHDGGIVAPGTATKVELRYPIATIYLI
jgi:hypothetical protein